MVEATGRGQGGVEWGLLTFPGPLPALLSCALL